MNENTPESISYEHYKEEIKNMRDADQAMRKRAEDNNGVIESEEDDKLDSIHTERMKEIIAEIGWPTFSKVGKEIASNAWLLVQHADHDVAFQRRCLDMMKKEPAGEVEVIDIAYLEDRVRVNEGKSQLYGTQFFNDKKPDGTVVYGPRPIEDPENLDKRRMSVGLGSFEEYKKHMLEKY